MFNPYDLEPFKAEISGKEATRIVGPHIGNFATYAQIILVWEIFGQFDVALMALWQGPM